MISFLFCLVFLAHNDLSYQFLVLFLLVFCYREWIYLFDFFSFVQERKVWKKELFPCLTYFWFKDIFTRLSFLLNVFNTEKLFGPCTFFFRVFIFWLWKFISHVLTNFPFHFLQHSVFSPFEGQVRCETQRNGKNIIL